MGSNEAGGGVLVGPPRAFNSTGGLIKVVKEGDCVATASAGPSEKEGVRLHYDQVGRYEIPVFVVCPTEQRYRPLVTSVFGDQ